MVRCPLGNSRLWLPLERDLEPLRPSYRLQAYIACTRPSPTRLLALQRARGVLLPDSPAALSRRVLNAVPDLGWHGVGVIPMSRYGRRGGLIHTQVDGARKSTGNNKGPGCSAAWESTAAADGSYPALATIDVYIHIHTSHELLPHARRTACNNIGTLRELRH